MSAMKTVKVSDLSGAALDWAVAKCEGFSDWDAEDEGFLLFDDSPGWWPLHTSCNYSTDWSQGGPIIERECIRIDHSWQTDCLGNCVGGAKSWYALHPRNFGGLIWYQGRGATALEAAMRCYVASKLGDTVEVPDELC